MPTSAKEARRVITQAFVEFFASETLNREREFKQEQTYQDYPAAGGNYQAALWRWAWNVTPSSVTETPKRYALPETPETRANVWLTQYDYVLWRAVVLYGLKAGEGFQAHHWRYLARLAAFARDLGADALFQEIARDRRWRKPKGQPSDSKSMFENSKNPNRSADFAVLFDHLPQQTGDAIHS